MIDCHVCCRGCAAPVCAVWRGAGCDWQIRGFGTTPGRTLIMVDDERMPLHEGEVPMMRSVRFRTLGCYPLSGAVESEAATLEEVIQEMLLTKTSERQGRMIDHDSAGSMEKKKQEGYF